VFLGKTVMILASLYPGIVEYKCKLNAVVTLVGDCMALHPVGSRITPVPLVI